jgi:hypothetical protein
MYRTFISPASPHRLGNGSGKNVSCFPACGHASHVCVSSVNDLVTWQWQRGSAFAWTNMQWNVTLIEATSSMCLIFLPVTHSDHVLGKPTTWASTLQIKYANSNVHAKKNAKKKQELQFSSQLSLPSTKNLTPCPKMRETPSISPRWCTRPGLASPCQATMEGSPGGSKFLTYPWHPYTPSGCSQRFHSAARENEDLGSGKCLSSGKLHMFTWCSRVL